jgi:hypothetical protein
MRAGVWARQTLAAAGVDPLFHCLSDAFYLT